jgi:glycosyltransferase involved in cell wall biosynthesis
MKLSIITCCYNSDKYIQETINSVISQKLDKNIYEHIFIDAFSSDNTIDIINKYIMENSENKIVLKQSKPKGIYNAMNE